MKINAYITTYFGDIEKMSEFKLKWTCNLLHDSTWPCLQAIPFKGHMQSNSFWNSQVKLGIFSAAGI